MFNNHKYNVDERRMEESRRMESHQIMQRIYIYIKFMFN